MAQALVIAAILILFIACYLLAKREDKITDLQKRLDILERKTAKKNPHILFEFRSIQKCFKTFKLFKPLNF